MILPGLKLVFAKLAVKKLENHHVLDMKYCGNYLFQDCLRKKTIHIFPSL